MYSSSLTRRVCVAGVVVIASIAMVASGEEKAADDKGTGTTISQGLGSKDASADVTAPAIVREGEAPFTLTYATANITNNSTEASDYFVTIAVESPDGSTRYDETMLMVQSLEPGQTSSQKGIVTKTDIPADAVAVVKEVQRTAAV